MIERKERVILGAIKLNALALSGSSTKEEAETFYEIIQSLMWKLEEDKKDERD